jgi:hypothetical protein
MKFLSTISFIVLVELICLTQMTLSMQCLEYINPIYRHKTRFVDCPMVSSKDKRQVTPGNPEPSTPEPTPASNEKFIVDFLCLIDDKTLCDKVDNVFITAGKFITETLNLKSQITVAAKFFDFCTMGECGAGGKIILGAAGPARFIPHQDPKDNKIRMYPQALFKQFDLPDEHPQLGQYDIKAVFNSNMKYWFEGDPEPMSISQVDMLYVVLHELVHGLGFSTSWSDHKKIQALTPFFASLPSNPTIGKFLELTFDKNLVFLPSGKSLTSFTDELNKFQFTSDMSDTQIIQAFRASPQFQIAQDLFAKASVQGTMGILLTPDPPSNTELTQDQLNNDVLLLETSIIPFTQGRSISHVDELTYLNSSDFLMVSEYPKKYTLGQLMANANSTNTTGPIGPQLRRLLEIMG